MYSAKAAYLNDMAKADFNWDESTWTHDYRGDFDKLKQSIIDSLSIYLPTTTCNGFCAPMPLKLESDRSSSNSSPVNPLSLTTNLLIGNSR